MLHNQTKATEATEQSHFFLPNFCSTRTLYSVVVAIELMAMLVSVMATPTLSLDWNRFGLISFFMQWIALTSMALLCSLRKRMADFSLRRAGTISYTIILITTLIISWAALALAPDMIMDSASVSDEWSFVTRNLLIAAVIGLVLLRYFYVLGQWRMQVKSEANARLDALQARINPHFLFNSMNVIASLTREDPEQAEMVTLDLCALFRANLQKAGTEVDFHEELALCRQYLRIEKIRLGKRLQLEWELPEQIPVGVKVPLLLLQPILENAIHHGIQRCLSGGVINIRVSTTKDNLFVVVTNPVGSNEASGTATPTSARSPATKGNGIAIDNIKERLSTIYGLQAGIVLTEGQKQFKVTLKIPLSREEE